MNGVPLSPGSEVGHQEPVESGVEVLPAGFMAVLLGLGQGHKQQVPHGQQHTVVEEQQQLLQGVEELVQGLRELGLQRTIESGWNKIPRAMRFCPCWIAPSQELCLWGDGSSDS